MDFCSAHFAVIPLPLVEGWHWAVATSERHWQRSRAEYHNHSMHNLISSNLDFTPQLVGSVPTSMAHLGQTEETGGGHTPRAPISQPRGRPPKGHDMKDGARNSPSSSPDRGGADSDGYSMASEVLSTHCRRRRWWGEKLLAPAHLDMLISSQLTQMWM